MNLTDVSPRGILHHHMETSDTTTASEPLLNVAEVARLMGMSEKWVYLHTDELPVIRVGRAFRFRRSEIEAWLDRQKGPDDAEGAA